MSADTKALLIVAAILLAVCLAPRLPRLHVWRRCRCGAKYCITCNRRGN